MICWKGGEDMLNIKTVGHENWGGIGMGRGINLLPDRFFVILKLFTLPLQFTIVFHHHDSLSIVYNLQFFCQKQYKSMRIWSTLFSSLSVIN